MEGADAIRRIVNESGDLQLAKLYFDMPAFHNRLHASADPRAGVKSAVRAILPPVDQSLFPSASALPGGLGTPLATGLARYNAKVSEIMTRLDAGALSPERLAHEMEDAVRILRTPETRRACGTLLTMMAIAEHPTIGAKEIGGYYQHFCGERIPRGMGTL